MRLLAQYLLSDIRMSLLFFLNLKQFQQLQRLHLQLKVQHVPQLNLIKKPQLKQLSFLDVLPTKRKNKWVHLFDFVIYGAYTLLYQNSCKKTKNEPIETKTLKNRYLSIRTSGYFYRHYTVHILNDYLNLSHLLEDWINNQTINIQRHVTSRTIVSNHCVTIKKNF